MGSVRLRGLTDVTEGSVYPALTRPERDGLLRSRRVADSGGPPRKYYRLSPAGKRQLHDRSAAWAALVANVDPFLRGDTA